MLDLRPGKTYQMKLTALTVNGTGPYTGWLEATTFTSDLDESIVPEPPAVLRAKETHFIRFYLKFFKIFSDKKLTNGHTEGFSEVQNIILTFV